MRPIIAVVAVLLLSVPLLGSDGCDTNTSSTPHSSSGVTKARVKVPVDPAGLTIEQKNIRDRLLQDNTPGAVKHLYVISAYSGDVLIYSTVRGKVTSGGKRLTPTTLLGGDPRNGGSWENTEVGSTTEVLQDDGTYGSSMDYLYWWDTKGVYHQHYVAGGQIIHISSEPLAVKKILINLSSDEK